MSRLHKSHTGFSLGSIIVSLLAVFAFVFASVSFAAPAFATGNNGKAHSNGKAAHGSSKAHSNGKAHSNNGKAAHGSSKAYSNGRAQGNNDKAAQGSPSGDSETPETSKGNSKPGNNGTVKIASLSDSSGHPDNTPHVGCGFRVEWFGFDDDASSTVTFAAQAPTSSASPQVTSGDTTVQWEGRGDRKLNAVEDYYLSFSGDPHPKQGYHVKLTTNTSYSNGNDVKHKVFWVQGCEDATDSTQGSSEEETPELGAGDGVAVPGVDEEENSEVSTGDQDDSSQNFSNEDTSSNSDEEASSVSGDDSKDVLGSFFSTQDNPGGSAQGSTLGDNTQVPTNLEAGAPAPGSSQQMSGPGYAALGSLITLLLVVAGVGIRKLVS